MTRKPKAPTALFSALADATRCRIVEILLAGPIPVHKLADSFAISRPAISRHLRVLKTAGLVVEVKKGRENLYTLRASRLTSAITWLERVVDPAKAETTIVASPSPTPQAVTDQQSAKAPKRRKAKNLPAADAGLSESPLVVSPEVKQDRAAQAPKPAPVSQMGFDF